MAIKQIIDETRETLAEDREAGRTAFTTGSDLTGPVEVQVTIGEHTVRVDEPEGLGGGGTAPNPVEYALASLGSCQAITYRIWAEQLGLRIDKVRVRVDGDLDLRGFFGVEDAVRPGFDGVRVEVDVEGPEDDDVYEQLFQAVNDHCPVLDVFENPVPVETLLRVGRVEAGAAEKA